MRLPDGGPRPNVVATRAPRFAHTFAGCLAVVATVGVSLAAGAFQGTASSTPAPAPSELDAVVTRFVTAAREYQRVFLNLVAEETKVAEVFDQSGRLKKQRTIVADLLVYRPVQVRNEKAPKINLKMAFFISTSPDAAEFRDVRAVDGKAVAKQSTRALDLLTRASQSGSRQKEIEIINRESFRHDLGYGFTGVTINQPVWLELREMFPAKWVGRERIDGHDVVVLDYQEAPGTSHLNREFYKDQGFTSSFTRGRVWIDAVSSQLRRDRWEVAGVHPALPDPVTIVRREGTFTESRFGILVPQRGVVEFFERGKQVKNQPPTYFRAARTTFTCTAFRQFNVATEETIATPAPAK